MILLTKLLRLAPVGQRSIYIKVDEKNQQIARRRIVLADRRNP